MPLPMGISVEPRNAQKLHEWLIANSLLNYVLRPLRLEGVVVFPIKGKMPATKTKELFKALKIPDRQGLKIVRKKFAKRETANRNLKEALEGKLPEKQLKFVPSSFDLLGDVAIIEVPKELKGKERILGKALLGIHKSVKSVFMKTGAHSGLFREEPVKLVAGKRTKSAIYREHGCAFRISIGKVFFSPRLSTERQRIAKLIRPGEKVAALFAGVGPFPIVFAKLSRMGKAVAIELNPVAVEDMKHNIGLNKSTGRVEAILGDVKELSHGPEYAGRFDRAVMPLPKGGEDFLEDAIRYIRPEGGVVHYYQFVSRDDPYKVPLEQIERACRNLGRGFEVLLKRQVREYAPDIIQVVVDFRVWKKPL